MTQEILDQLPKPLPHVGMLNLFVQHTSCALSINENYDPDEDGTVIISLKHYEADQAGAGRQVESYAEGAACNLDGTGC